MKMMCWKLETSNEAGFPHFVDNNVNNYIYTKENSFSQSFKQDLYTLKTLVNWRIWQEIEKVLITYPQVMHNLWISENENNLILWKCG